jgi:hypothetical protein
MIWTAAWRAAAACQIGTPEIGHPGIWPVFAGSLVELAALSNNERPTVNWLLLPEEPNEHQTPREARQ